MADVERLGGGLGFCSWTRRLASGLLIADGSSLRQAGARHGRACLAWEGAEWGASLV